MKKTQIQFRLPEDKKKEYIDLAKKKGRGVSGLIRDMLDLEIEQNRTQKDTMKDTKDKET